MKKIGIGLLLFLTTFMLWLAVINIPISAPAKNLPSLTDTAVIRKDLTAIISTKNSRDYKHTEVLDSVAQYIQQVFLSCTNRSSFQDYVVDGKRYRNIIASFGPMEGERIIIGAHYDVCGNQNGADDNASGTAGLLSLARLLKNKDIKTRIDLVAYTLEEPPFFNTEYMGSYVHAKSLYDASIPVKGMISLEMIGYFSNESNSQDYPVGLMKWFYGNTGNYITLVQKPFNKSFAKQFKKSCFRNNSIDIKSIKAPAIFGGIDLSDHRNYWKFGYSAVMITNTAFFRNKNYHTKQDVLPSLNIAKMGLVIDGVYRALLDL